VAHVGFALGSLHRENVTNVVGGSEVHTASIFRVEVSMKSVRIYKGFWFDKPTGEGVVGAPSGPQEPVDM
jgi:hypothetical protein